MCYFGILSTFGCPRTELKEHEISALQQQLSGGNLFHQAPDGNTCQCVTRSPSQAPELATCAQGQAYMDQYASYRWDAEQNHTVGVLQFYLHRRPAGRDPGVSLRSRARVHTLRKGWGLVARRRHRPFAASGRPCGPCHPAVDFDPEDRDDRRSSQIRAPLESLEANTSLPWKSFRTHPKCVSLSAKSRKSVPRQATTNTLPGWILLPCS